MKTKTSILKKKLWTVFSKWIKQRDKNICFTCGRKCEGQGSHAGHFEPKSVGGLALYFNEDNVRCQCFNCNINLSGNQYIFGEKLGKKMVKKLYSLKDKTIKWSESDYLEKIEEYKKKLK